MRDKVKRIGFYNNGGKWCATYRRAGHKSVARLGIPASCKNFDDEEKDIQSRVWDAWSEYVQTEADNPRPSSCPFKTWDQAVDKYLEACQHQKDFKCKRNKGKSFIDYFGYRKIAELDYTIAREWAESIIDKQVSFDTFRLRVTFASSLLNWMRKNRYWLLDNPFSGIVGEYEYRFKARTMDNRRTITDDEYTALLAAAHGPKRRNIRLFIELSRMTGLRPSEVLNLDTRRLNRSALTWSIEVTKTRQRPFWRTIAIPERVVALLANEGVGDGPVFERKSIKHGFQNTCRDATIELCMKTFRKDFFNRLIAAGCPRDYANLHQGRNLNGVDIEHYADRREITEVTREYVDAMFAGEKGFGVIRTLSEA